MKCDKHHLPYQKVDSGKHTVLLACSSGCSKLVDKYVSANLRHKTVREEML